MDMRNEKAPNSELLDKLNHELDGLSPAEIAHRFHMALKDRSYEEVRDTGNILCTYAAHFNT